MDRTSKWTIRKVCLDVLLLMCVGFPILFFYLFGEPYKRGFYCDDDSIMYPYKDSTITNTALYIVGLFLPIITMLATEYVHSRKKSQGKEIRIHGRLIPLWILRSYNEIGVFGFGAACSQLTTDIAKYSIGRLRPHFMSVCRPIGIDCKNVTLLHEYIDNFTCGGTDEHRLKESRLSFPSGHSSFSAYTMIYMAIYIQARFRWKGSKLLQHFLQFLCLMLAWYTALSRVSDYKHHWSDVLAGAAQGSLVAILVWWLRSCDEKQEMCKVSTSPRAVGPMRTEVATDNGPSSQPTTETSHSTVQSNGNAAYVSDLFPKAKYHSEMLPLTENSQEVPMESKGDRHGQFREPV